MFAPFITNVPYLTPIFSNKTLKRNSSNYRREHQNLLQLSELAQFYYFLEFCTRTDKLQPGPAEINYGLFRSKSITRPRKIDMLSKMCFCASEIMRSRTAYQIDPCTASAVDAERKNIYSDTTSLVNQQLLHYISASSKPSYKRCRDASEHLYFNVSSLSNSI